MLVSVTSVMCCIVCAVELASKEVQHELDEIQRHLSEFLSAEENAMKERIRYMIPSVELSVVIATGTYS